MNRRHFLAAIPATTLMAKTLSPIGFQLYTLRNVWPKDPEGTIARVAAIGFQEVEFYGVDQIEKLGPICAKNGIKPASIHIPAQVALASDGGEFEKALSASKAAGIRFGGVPYMNPKERGPATNASEFWKTWCGQMNKAGAIAKKHGITFFYHNHAFEFAGTPGERPIDYMHKELDPKLVKLEMDVFWVAQGGADLYDTVRAWDGRIATVHLKDRAKDAAVVTTESQTKPADFKEVGQGSIDFGKLIPALRRAGAQKFFVEQDQCPGDPLVSLKLSATYLKQLSV